VSKVQQYQIFDKSKWIKFVRSYNQTPDSIIAHKRNIYKLL